MTWDWRVGDTFEAFGYTRVVVEIQEKLTLGSPVLMIFNRRSDFGELWLGQVNRSVPTQQAAEEFLAWWERVPQIVHSAADYYEEKGRNFQHDPELAPETLLAELQALRRVDFSPKNDVPGRARPLLLGAQ
jgi:hypothetical protein